MNKQKQEIVPVKWQKEHSNNLGVKAHPQKLVARLKRKETELFVYESIHDTTLQVLLSEWIPHENR